MAPAMCGAVSLGSLILKTRNVKVGMAMVGKSEKMVLAPKIFVSLSVAVLWCVAFLPGVAWAQDMVSGKYTSSSGTTIVLELTIQEPPPGNLIVHQFLPKGVHLVSSSPAATKFSAKKGKAKWLVKKVRSGTMRITMELSKAIGAGTLRAEVRCRDQVTGKMTDIVIQ